MVGAALRLAFPAGPVPANTPFTALDDRQRRLARVLAAAPGSWCWSGQKRFGNFDMAVGGYGLPSSNSRMHEYVRTA